MHEPKVNTNHCGATPSEAKKAILLRAEQVRRLAGLADTIGAMLGVFALLPESGQADALAVSAELAGDLAEELGVIVGGAA